MAVSGAITRALPSTTWKSIFIWSPMRAALSSTRLGTKPGRPDLGRGVVT
jgi:hypothetical protein